MEEQEAPEKRQSRDRERESRWRVRRARHEDKMAEQKSAPLPLLRPIPGQLPPCSWPGPAGAAAPPPHCFVARPALPQGVAQSPQLLRRLERERH